MSQVQLVIKYRDSENLVRNAWARRRRREALQMAAASFALPVVAVCLAAFISSLDPPSFGAAPHFLQTGAGVCMALAGAVGGMIMAFLTIIHTDDARLGTLPRFLGPAGLFLNTAIFLLFSSVLSYGIPWTTVP